MCNELPKVLITGASGMLGTALIHLLSNYYQIYATSRTMGYQNKNVIWKLINLYDIDYLYNWVRTIKPDIFIHCAALTNVDACENEVEEATLLHVKIPEIVLEAISDWNGHFIYISTDAVFDGTKLTSYTEEDPVSPINVYGQTKANGEKIVVGYSNGLVLRTNIFGFNILNRQFFAEWIINGLRKKEKLTLFTDVIFNPVHVVHLSNYILFFIKNSTNGLLNAGGQNTLSKYDFGIKLSKIFNLPSDKITPCLLKDVSLKAARSKNMSLSIEKITKLGILPYNVEDGINLLKDQYYNGWLEKIKNGKVILENYT